MCDCAYLTKDQVRIGDVIHFSRRNIKEHHTSNRWLVLRTLEGEWVALDIYEYEDLDAGRYRMMMPVFSEHTYPLQVRKLNLSREPRGKYAR